jgi:hypothetical protein
MTLEIEQKPISHFNSLSSLTYYLIEEISTTVRLKVDENLDKKVLTL